MWNEQAKAFPIARNAQTLKSSLLSRGVQFARPTTAFICSPACIRGPVAFISSLRRLLFSYPNPHVWLKLETRLFHSLILAHAALGPLGVL